MGSDADTEMRWVEAWNQLHDLSPTRDAPCQLPDWSVVGVEECKAWLQASVYEGYLVQVEAGWVGHRRGIIVSRSLPDGGG